MMSYKKTIRTIAKESPHPYTIFSNDGMNGASGLFHAKYSKHEKLEKLLADTVKTKGIKIGKTEKISKGITLRSFSYKGKKIYQSGMLVHYIRPDLINKFEITLSDKIKFPKLEKKPDPSVAIEYVKKNRILEGDMDDPFVPVPELIWFDPYLVFGEKKPVAQAWLFSFTTDPVADVIVSLDGAATVAVIGKVSDTDNPYIHTNTPQYLVDDITGVPRFIRFSPALILPPVSSNNPVRVAESFFQTFKEIYGTGDPSQQLTYKTSEQDLDGGHHIIFQQNYAGIEVWGCELRVHLTRQLAITSISGRYYREPYVDIEHTLSENAAYSIALSAWTEISGNESLRSGQAIEHKGIVIFPSKFLNQDNPNQLAWWFRFPDADRFVDAHTGKLIISISRVFYFRKVFSLAHMAPTPSNINNATLDMLDGTPVTNILAINAPLADRSLKILQDFWINSMNRNSWDGQGGDMVIYLDALFDDPKTSIVEEVFLWDSVGNYAMFSDNAVEPDLIGHEFMHGVIHTSARFVYAAEPGAMSESFADVFAKLIFPHPLPWKIGVQVAAQIGAGSVFPKNLETPTVGNYADFMAVDPFTTFTEFEINCGIGDRAAVLLASGNNTPAHIGIGAEKVARVWWDILTTRLFPWAFYIDMAINAFEVIVGLKRDGKPGVALPRTPLDPISGEPQPSLPSFINADVDELLWAFNEVGLNFRLTSGWFRVPNGTTTNYVRYAGELMAPNELVDHIIINVSHNMKTGVDGPVLYGVFDFSSGIANPTKSFNGGTIIVTITKHGLGTRSKEVRLTVTTANFADIDIQVGIKPLVVSPAPAGHTPVPFKKYSSTIAHWFDNPFFAGRKYADVVNQFTSLPLGYSLSDVELELMDKNGNPTTFKTRLGDPGAVDGAHGAWIFSHSPLGGDDLEVRVRSWHDFGSIVRYRLVYTIIASTAAVPTLPDDCTLPPFRIREVIPIENL